MKPLYEQGSGLRVQGSVRTLTPDPLPQAAAPRPVRPVLDVQRIRQDFPILHTRVHGKPLIYLDNAATSQKPRVVIERLQRYYSAENANIHRGVYELSQRATAEYDEARRKVQRFVNAAHDHEIIFTRGTTESINLVAQTYGRKFIREGDEIIISWMEHHSNIVPWQMLCEQTGAKLRVVPVDDTGHIIIDEYLKLFSGRTRFVSIVHLSNALGTINPVKHMIEVAHRHGVPVLVDGAQWAPHGPTDVRDLDADFYAFSGHKVYGPTGIGVLYGKSKHLEAMPPYQGGGDMIASVSFNGTTYAELPHKFEAGTPNIAGAIGLGAAIEYVQQIGFERIVSYEQELLQYAVHRLSEIPGLRILGNAACRAGVTSFVMEDPRVSSMDIGTELDRDGIAIRTGHHCCMPLMGRMGVDSTARASFSFYNTREEIDALADALVRVREKALSRRAAAKPAAVVPGGDGLQWPAAVASSPQAAADELAETFDLIGEREAKNEYVLDLGSRLPHTFDLLKTITSRVPGCMSEVYVVARPAPEKPGAVQFMADANADIVRGLIAILEQLYSGQRAQDILSFDIEAFFRRIGLEQFISSQRRNGLAGMVQRVRALARSIAEQGPAAVAEQQR